LAGTNPFVRLDCTRYDRNESPAGVNVESDTKAPPQDSPIDIISLGPAAAFVVATKIAFYWGLIMLTVRLLFCRTVCFPALRNP